MKTETQKILHRGHGSRSIKIYPPGVGCTSHPGSPVFSEHWAVVWSIPSMPEGNTTIQVATSSEAAVALVDQSIGPGDWQELTQEGDSKPVVQGAKIVQLNELQWLILPDEETALYTNFGDGRPGDASELVSKVNADPTLNGGHSNWRLPEIYELKTLVGTDQAPATGRYWSASPLAYSTDSAWNVLFSYGSDYYGNKSRADRVRLVRSCG